MFVLPSHASNERQRDLRVSDDLEVDELQFCGYFFGAAIAMLGGRLDTSFTPILHWGATADAVYSITHCLGCGAQDADIFMGYKLIA